MIGYLAGQLLKKEEDRILLLVNQIGYEILLPAVVMESFKTKSVGDEVSLYIYIPGPKCPSGAYDDRAGTVSERIARTSEGVIRAQIASLGRSSVPARTLRTG